MTRRVTRRDFVRVSAAAGAGVLAAAHAGAATDAPVGAPGILAPKGTKPVVIASRNGNEFKNGGPRTCVEEVFSRLTRGDDVLAALVAGANIVELDPLEDTVGYGGIPNADGVVQLDAAVMHGTKGWAGGVAALEGVRTPSSVARLIAEQTDHHLLVGRGAQVFARSMGFTIEDDLNTEHSRAKWLEWKREIDPKHWIDPATREKAAAAARSAMIASGRLDPEKVHGTIHASGLAPDGSIAATTTTSGLSFKIPGRVGDSPILGAGLYAAHGVGAAGSTGRGEATLYHLSSFFVVERLRAGAHPKDACIEALRRILAATRERRLLNGHGRPNFDVKFYSLDARGRHAGACFYGGPKSLYAVCDESGSRSVPLEAILEGSPED